MIGRRLFYSQLPSPCPRISKNFKLKIGQLYFQVLIFRLDPAINGQAIGLENLLVAHVHFTV